jgi:tetratricopeptide (TPR) repeat protein
MFDNQGLPLTSQNPVAAVAFNTAMTELLDYRLSAMPTLKGALEVEPDFFMAHVLRGYMLLMMNTAKMIPTARHAYAAAKAHVGGVTEREKMHLEALRCYAYGDWSGASARLASICSRFPLDIIALRVHHAVSFWMGRSQQLFTVPSAVLNDWKEDIPNYGNVLGMLCFGLEENGHYAKAEGYGRKAVELNPDDLWSVHSVAHVLEMTQRHKEGLKWLDYPADVWDDRNPFRGHLWWHRGLYLLELRQLDEAVALYDSVIFDTQSSFFLDLQNAAAFLIRLELLGVDVGDRWDALAGPAQGGIGDHELAFTDIHNVLALARAGRLDAAQEFVNSMRIYAKENNSWSAKVQTRVGIPMAESLIAYEVGDYDTALQQIGQYKPIFHEVGASHAQRDVISLVEIDAARNSGKGEVLAYLLRQREYMTKLATLDGI